VVEDIKCQTYINKSCKAGVGEWNDFSLKLNNAFGVAGFLAQQTKSYQDQIICAYGIYFPIFIFFINKVFKTWQRKKLKYN
jgi:hypothetical protein